MKTLLFALATLAAGAGSAHAELFSPTVLPGAIIGGIAGGVIGNNAGGHNGADGAIIGAVAGGVIGAAIDSDRRETRYYDSRSYDNRGYDTDCRPPVVYSAPPVVYREAPRTRVVYVEPAPRVVYVEPRHEVIVRHEDRRDYGHSRAYEHRAYEHGRRDFRDYGYRR